MQYETREQAEKEGLNVMTIKDFVEDFKDVYPFGSNLAGNKKPPIEAMGYQMKTDKVSYLREYRMRFVVLDLTTLKFLESSMIKKGGKKSGYKLPKKFSQYFPSEE